MKLAIKLFAMVQAFKLTAYRDPAFGARLKERNLVAQLRLRDGSVARYIEIRDGKVLSKAELHPNPDIVLGFKNADVADQMLSLKQDYRANIHGMKNFTISLDGPDVLTAWFMETLQMVQRVGWKYGEDLGQGVTRFTGNNNGGPVHVHVKDGKIQRITPIEFTEEDGPTWSINARGKTFTPPRQTTLPPHVLAGKSLVYSKNRLLYPMKRVDFDPQGERNPQNRGTSGYVRISWDEALDLVAGEIKRIKRDYGPSALAFTHSAHQMWGNVGYHLSSGFRFFNLLGFTKVHGNPQSWEGWYWGAVHHWGHTMRLGQGEVFGQVEDILKNCEMMVFWSSDPEATSGCYGGLEGTVRRMWAKELGIKFVHIDPYFNETAALLGGKWIAPRPGTDPALAQAICHVWITEGLYDKWYVENRTTGFAEWSDHVLGVDDGVPKTPEWAEAETGVPARDIRALAREWGSKKVYLGAGGMGNTFGGACRTATGTQWARMMVIMMGMQGYGRPGVNMGNMQIGTPVDFNFWFPGYAEGGISGDLQFTANGPINYQQIPHIMSMNNVRQQIPRIEFPEAIMNGTASGYPTDVSSITNQFLPFKYPAPGQEPVRMMYKFGASQFGTQSGSNRWVRTYQSDKIEFVVNQSIWFEGEAKFADVILPACTNFERWDIGEWASAGGYAPQYFAQLNHRVVVLQHKCIEPLGESKSDYQIYAELAQRLGLSALFTEGMSEIDWCRRIWEGSDLSKHISWKKLLKKGYYVVPPEKENMRVPTAYSWYYEGRKKDVPEMQPLPADYTENFLEGLQTRSGKFEFVPSSLKLANDPDRPAVNKYIRSWEGCSTTELLDKYPLQLLSSHPRYSFHTQADGKDSTINDVKSHRMLVEGHYYLQIRMSPEDAALRGIRTGDLVRAFNDRGAVIFAAKVSPRLRPGVAHTYESSAVYEPVGKPGYSADRGGCVNLLTNHRSQIRGGSAMAPNACLIQLELWQPDRDTGVQSGAAAKAETVVA
ncbi:molybdopterin-dependent oxidoreductase [Rhodoferax sp.]|uniref:molybdopterin-dependent oxidoreductase n=1 Tax=Rhodoferax sp. TaxID=50421 RepID=UPI002631235E|nr:molybdopterin-dependent oxidoreductase [Rhodoferax sp.]MDD2924330.1 molybdopterin-dependent oxidoreductase [Rhodoferax sp.]